ncbi:MAG TPA: hypothetical protein VFQ36_12650 [Ktedonobacteraceae bacterium]|nr:hypothetical protein [Ktedonobacteraceae bacterium]
MIPTNNLRNFAKYKVVITTRQSDGAKLTATRVIKNSTLPVRWDTEVTYPRPSAFTAPVSEIQKSLSTSQLIGKGQVEGFGDWYPTIEKMVEIFPIDAPGDKSKMRLAPKYSEPDTAEYLVD